MKTQLLLASLAASALALPSTSYTVHQKRDEDLIPWTKRGAPNGASNVSVRIALKQNNLEYGAKKLMDISDPRSKNYGKHLTKAQVIDMFAATDETISSVKSWLVGSGIPAKAITVSKAKTWITVTTTIANLEKALKTKYHYYNSDLVKGDHIGADEYSLPSDISDSIDYIMPGLSKSKINSRATGGKPSTYAIKEPPRPLAQDAVQQLKANISSLSICDTVITPQCIKAIYGIPPGKLSNVTNPMGIFESLGDVYAQEDLDEFFKLAAPEIPQGTGPQLDLINGATAPNSQDEAGGESDLDFQIAYPIIYPQGTVLFQVSQNTESDIFNDFLDAIDGPFCNEDDEKTPGNMCGTFDPTSVVSISYGGDEYGNDVDHLKRQCNEFMKLGLLGITTVASSGDDGVASYDGYCLGPHHDIFVPTTVAGCPYITSVGSTLLPKGSKVGDPEVATTRFSSGGGFSNVFDRPDWQNNAVGYYLLRHNPNYFAYNTTNGVIPTTGKGIYNRGGRAYPDISALGDNGLVVYRGVPSLIGGTSMSAPLVGAILTRINEERLNVGKGPLGFVNPALYQAFDSGLNLYHDVTVGNQALGGPFGARQRNACGNDGFHCVAGWDPVSGLGTPKYNAWLNYFINL